MIFPILSTFIEIIDHGQPFTLSSFLIEQRENTLLWIIDTAIPILGIFGYKIGRQQQKLKNQADHLEEMVANRSEDIMKQKLFYEALVENSPIAIVTLDPNHHVVSANPAFEEIFGYRISEIFGQNLDDIVSSEKTRQEAHEITKGVLAGKTMHEFGKRRRKDGSFVDVEILGKPIDINGKRIGVLGLYRDITAEKIAQEKLQASEERFRSLFQDSPIALRLEDCSKMRKWLFEKQETSKLDIRDYFKENPDALLEMGKLAKIISLNSSSLFLFRAKNKADLQKNIGVILSKESRDDQIDIVCSLMDGETHLEKELVYETLDGEKIYVITKLTVLPGHEDDWGKILFSNMDITERKLAEERMSYISLHDMMTGLYNRAFFDEELARLEKSRTRPISILVCDMDGLKKTNDLYGHLAGDIALQNIANILKRCFRAEDVIARIGGDEFSVLLPNVTAELAHMIVQRIQRYIDVHNKANSIEAKLSISIGSASAEKGDSLLDIFKVADENMYQEKQRKKK